MRRTTRAVARLGTLAVLAGTALATPLAIGTASATVSAVTPTNGTVGSVEAAAARDDYPNQAQVTFTKDNPTDAITVTLSSTGAYFPLTQSDGNVVLYGPTGRAVWAIGRTDTDRFIFQSDGNLVAYTASGAPTWSSRTAGSAATVFVVQSDGNLVIYASGRPVWASNTAGRT